MDNWHTLNSEEQLNDIVAASHKRPQLIFKHSTRCGISASAQDRLFDAAGDLARHMDLHFLDLIAFRPVSNAIAKRLNVPHQSPQVIVLQQGEAVYAASHYGISPEKIRGAAL